MKRRGTIDFKKPRGGLCIEIVQEVYTSQGYELHVENAPWARALMLVKEGHYDILPNAWLSQERTQFLAYSTPYAKVRVKVVKKKGDVFEYTGIQCLSKKRVGIVRGADYGTEFTNAIDISKEEGTNMIQNTKKLIAGRIDLILEDQIGLVTTLLEKAPTLLRDIEFETTPFSNNELYVACGLGNPRCQKLIETFNRGLEQIKANGTYRAILSRYGLKEGSIQ